MDENIKKFVEQYGDKRWRLEVFDTPSGFSVITAADVTQALGLRLFLHNDRIFRVDADGGFEQVGTLNTSGGVR